jgi:hypothetical protein
MPACIVPRGNLGSALEQAMGIDAFFLFLNLAVTS